MNIKPKLFHQSHTYRIYVTIIEQNENKIMVGISEKLHIERKTVYLV